MNLVPIFCGFVFFGSVKKYCANFQWERLENFRKRQRQEIFRSEVENLAMIFYSGRFFLLVSFSFSKKRKVTINSREKYLHDYYRKQKIIRIKELFRKIASFLAMTDG